MRVLRVEGLRFGSDGDERAFFEWLERIDGLANMRGERTTLEIEVEEPISDRALRELIALFSRYGVGMRDLRYFESESNRSWFRAESAFWHEKVFGSGKVVAGAV